MRKRPQTLLVVSMQCGGSRGKKKTHPLSKGAKNKIKEDNKQSLSSPCNVEAVSKNRIFLDSSLVGAGSLKPAGLGVSLPK
jgi:hypothetical protein